MSKAKIVLATCHGAGSRQLFNLEFDVVIIDEATQAVEAVCWIPILKSKKLILAGDPMQLPPTVISTGSERKKKAIAASSTKNVSNTSSKAGKSATKGQAAPEPIEDESEGEGSEEMDEVLEDEEDEDEGASTTSAPSKTSTKKAKTKFKMGTLKPSKSLEVTLFDRLEKMYGRKIIKMLTVQYRMHELICSFPSSVLYKKKLKSHPSVKKHLLRDLPSISQAESDIDVVGLPVVFFDTAGCEYFERVDGEGGSADEGSRSNENEALVVKQWVEKLCVVGDSATVSSGSPYLKQWMGWLEENADVRFGGLD
ncbi:hypothetical protein FRC02_011855 [Tulasnella sp. 418]|nr:hypothetical protein FRC02_011855 [Tulasnella sp. 418]